MWCGGGGGGGGGTAVDGCTVGVSIDDFPAANALILLKTSFFKTVGDEHGLTDGVLFAEIVLLLKFNWFYVDQYSSHVHIYYLIFV